jgi:NAD(P)-dependent dehydrogenase (short-subunit alcohol dehydrogenase family)
MQPTVVLVTGATDGLGKGVAAALLDRGATVLVHGRDPQRLEATLAELGDGREDRVRGYLADLSSLAEVRRLAGEIRLGEPRLDVLVSNAGIGSSVPGGPERQESRDGHELRFAVNYLAGWLLTRELLPLLKASAPARIVNVSSGGQEAIDFDDVMLERGYSGMRAYCQSKLAQILDTVTLAKELDEAGVSVTALHPATYMPTKIVRSPASTLQEGVDATVRLAVGEDVAGVTGAYFNGLRLARPDPQAEDPSARQRLLELSERLTAR